MSQHLYYIVLRSKTKTMFKNWSESQYMAYLANDGRGVFMLKDDNSGFMSGCTEGQKDTKNASSTSQARSTLTWETEMSAGKTLGTKIKPTFKN